LLKRRKNQAVPAEIREELRENLPKQDFEGTGPKSASGSRTSLKSEHEMDGCM
jgi:hypothetical protein